MKRTLVCVLVSLFVFGSGMVASDFPSADEVLRKAAVNENSFAAARREYSFHCRNESHELTAAREPGQLIAWTDWDAVAVAGKTYQYWKMVAKNGKPTDGEIQRTPATPNLGTLADMLRLMDSTVVGEEELNGRKTWVIQSEPRKDAVGRNHREQFLLCHRQMFWIDQQDLAIAQRYAETVCDLTQSGGILKPGSFRKLTYGKQNGTDWLDESWIMFTKCGEKSCDGDKGLITVLTFSDYRKFNVQSTVTSDPKQ